MTSQAQSHSSTPPKWSLIALGAVVAAGLVHSYLIYAPSDDTYIYLVYAKNLLSGDGLTFNGARVQGFTSPLWMALVTLVGALRVPLPIAASLLSVLSGALVVVAAFLLGRRAGLSATVALVAPILVVGTGDFAFYSGNGLESNLASALILLSATFLFDDSPSRVLRAWRLPVVLGLAILARPESLLVAAIIIVTLALRSRDWMGAVRAGAGVVIVLAPVVVALRLYYGDWLPNTYYAKSAEGLSNLGHGLTYLANYARWYGIVLALLVMAALVRWRRFVPGGVPLFVIVWVWIAQVTVQGGDNMVGFRAYLPVLPLAYVTIAYGFRWVDGAVLIAIAFVLSAYLGASYSYAPIAGGAWGLIVRKQMQDWRNFYPVRKDVALALKRALPANATVAVNGAGIIPYYSELPTIDMLGLNDHHIAHNGRFFEAMAYGHQRGDGSYVLNQRPQVILFGAAGTRRGEKFPSESEISADSRFYSEYQARGLPHGRVGYFRISP